MLSSIVFALTLLVAVAEFILAGYVFVNNPGVPYNQAAAGRCLAAALFALFSIFFYFSPNLELAATWNRLRSIPLLFLPALTLLATWYWTQKRLDWTARLFHGLLVGTSLIFLLAAILTTIVGYPAPGSNLPWLNIPTSDPFWPLAFSGWAITLVSFAVILSIYHYSGLKEADDKKFQFPILLGLPLVVIPAVMVGLLPSEILPDSLVFLPLWTLIADLLVAVGLTSRQFFELSFSSAYQPILQSVDEGVALVAPDFTIHSVNPAFCRLVGKAESQLVGRPIERCFQEGQQAIERLARETISPGRPASPSELTLGGGKSIFVRLSGAPVLFQGRRRGMALIFSDQALQKEAEKKMQGRESEISQNYEQEQQEMQASIDQLNLALEQAGLKDQQLQHRIFELESLANLSSALRTSRSISEMLNILLAETVRILEADSGAIFLRSGSGLAAKSLLGISEEFKDLNLLPEGNVLWASFESEAPLFILSRQDSLPNSFPVFLSGTNIAAICPLRTAERKLGLLLVGFNSSESLGEKNKELLLAVGNIASNALFRSNTMESLEQSIVSRNRELEMLYRIASICVETQETRSMVNQVLQVLLDTFSARVGVVYLDQLQSRLFIAARPLMYLAEISAELKAIPLESSLWHFVHQSNQPLLAASLDDDTRIDIRIVTELIPLGSCTMLAVPVRGAGENLGAICLFRDVKNPFLPEDLALLTSAARQFATRVEVIQLSAAPSSNPEAIDPPLMVSDIYNELEEVLSYQYQVTQTSRQMIQSGEPRSFLPTLEQIGQLSHQALKQIRLLLYLNYPPEIEQLGLAGAIQRRLELVEQRASITTSVSGEYNFRLPGSLEIGLYQAAQEALNYFILHSNGTTVNVRLESDFNSIILEIVCNDCRVDPAQESQLFGLQVHVEALGGNLSTFTSPDSGSTIRIQV